MKKKVDPEVLLGQASIHYVQKDYRKAGDLIALAKLQASTPYRQARIAFLEACIKWELNVNNLVDNDWLFRKRGRQYFKLLKILQRVEKLLRSAVDLLAKESLDNYEVYLLQRSVNSHLAAVALERETSEDIIVKSLGNKPLAAILSFMKILSSRLSINKCAFGRIPLADLNKSSTPSKRYHVPTEPIYTKINLSLNPCESRKKASFL